MSSRTLRDTLIGFFDLHAENGGKGIRFVHPTAQGPTMIVGPTTGALIVSTKRYRLTIADRDGDAEYLYADLSGTLNRDDYLDLARLDTTLGGKVSECLIRRGFVDIGNQIRYHASVIEAGNGPIYAP